MFFFIVILQGTAFTVIERQLLGIHGLLPPSVLTMNQQVAKMLANLKDMNDDLQRYIYLISLQDRNEALFYKVYYLMWLQFFYI